MAQHSLLPEKVVITPDGGVPDDDTPPEPSAVARFLAAAETMRECVPETCCSIRRRPDAATRASLEQHISRMRAWVYSLDRALNRLEDAGPADD
jgi:hypothetical protein